MCSLMRMSRNLRRSSGDPDRLDVPVRSIVGSDDPFTFRHARRQHRWDRYAVSVDRVVLAGASHYFMKTHADELAGLLVEAHTQEVTR